jgi:hypothetical protein
MTLVSSFAVLWQELAIVMTAPSFQNFLTIATGWTFTSHRTVTGSPVNTDLPFFLCPV